MSLGLGMGLGLRRQGTSIADPSAGYALFLPFGAAGPTYRVGSSTYTDPTTMPGYTYTRSGAKSELNASGSPVAFAANVAGIVPGVGYWSRGVLTNYLLNAGSSGPLTTQNVTTTATQYTLSFIGTGTVTLSGASTAGPLVGTGASNRVILMFTPTAGTLTLTVTGSVTYAGLIDGNHPAGGPIIATSGAPASIGVDQQSSAGNTITTDQDFFVWVVANFEQATTGSSAVLLRWGDQAWFGRGGGGSLNISDALAAGAAADAAASPAGRCVVGLRRKAGKTSAAYKRPDGTITVTAEVVVAWPAVTSAIHVGHYGLGNFLPDAYEEGVYAQLGTFSDAQLTTILTNA